MEPLSAEHSGTDRGSFHFRLCICLLALWCLSFAANGAIYQLTLYFLPLITLAKKRTRQWFCVYAKTYAFWLFIILALPITFAETRRYIQTSAFDFDLLLTYSWRLILFPLAAAAIVRSYGIGILQAMRLLGLAALLYMLSGVAQFLGWSAEAPSQAMRMSGIVSDPNSFALLLACGFLALLSTLGRVNSKRELFCYIAALLLLGAGLAFAQSRGAWLALAASLATLVTVTWLGSNNNNKDNSENKTVSPLQPASLSLYVLLIFAAFGAFYLAMPEAGKVRLDNLFQDPIRMATWQHYLDKMDNWAVGHGLVHETFQFNNLDITAPHNVYLEVLYRAGIFGLAGYLLYLTWIFMAGLRAGLSAPYLLPLLALLCAASMVDYSIYGAELLQSLLALLAVFTIAAEPAGKT